MPLLLSNGSVCVGHRVPEVILHLPAFIAVQKPQDALCKWLSTLVLRKLHRNRGKVNNRQKLVLLIIVVVVMYSKMALDSTIDSSDTEADTLRRKFSSSRWVLVTLLDEESDHFTWNSRKYSPSQHDYSEKQKLLQHTDRFYLPANISQTPVCHSFLTDMFTLMIVIYNHIFLISRYVRPCFIPIGTQGDVIAFLSCMISWVTHDTERLSESKEYIRKGQEQCHRGIYRVNSL